MALNIQTGYCRQAKPVAYPGIFMWVGVYTTNFFSGDSTNAVEDRRQREQGSGGGSPLVRGSTQFSNE
jgi:hypothetical protein